MIMGAGMFKFWRHKQLGANPCIQKEGINDLSHGAMCDDEGGGGCGGDDIA